MERLALEQLGVLDGAQQKQPAIRAENGSGVLYAPAHTSNLRQVTSVWVRTGTCTALLIHQRGHASMNRNSREE